MTIMEKAASINPENYKYLKAFLKKESGYDLQDDKMYLLESRLSPLVRRFRYKDLNGMLDDARKNENDLLSFSISQSMTINETYFFRDNTPFETLKNHMIPALMKGRAGARIRIWSAASSTGQEAYSIAMMLDHESRNFPGLTYEIVGTDLAEAIVEKAKEGLYDSFEIKRGLPDEYLKKYFKQDGNMWRINDQIRKSVKFTTLNLIQPFPSYLGKFDIVFCRNVLIYFDVPTKRDILGRIEKMMNDQSFLMLGGAESVFGLSDAVKPHPEWRAVYVPARSLQK